MLSLKTTDDAVAELFATEKGRPSADPSRYRRITPVLYNRLRTFCTGYVY